MWLPEHFPATVIIHPAPPGFADRTGFDPNVLGVIVADRSHADGRELVIGDATGRIHVCLRHTGSTHRHAVIVPVDSIFRLRLDVLSRVALRLQGRRANLLPPALRLTSLQRSRLIHLLHTFDVHEDGGRVALRPKSSPPNRYRFVG
jgi:hypothetical protein